MKISCALVLACLTLPIALACGGDDDPESNGTFATSIPDSTQIGSLTPVQQTAICGDIDRFMSSPAILAPSSELACRLSGIFFSVSSMPSTDAETRSSCKVLYDECKKEPFEPEEAMCNPPDASCTATIAELKACMADFPGMLTDAVNRLPTCDTLTMAAWNDLSGEPEVSLSPACATIQERCPGFLSEE